MNSKQIQSLDDLIRVCSEQQDYVDDARAAIDKFEQSQQAILDIIQDMINA